MGSVEMASKLAAVAVAQDRDRKGSRSNLANIGIHAQERRCSRQAVEKQLTDKTILIKDPDGNIVECEVLGSHLKESFMQKSVPILPPAVAGLMFFLNLCPGLGTFIGAFTVLCGASTSYESKSKGFYIGLMTATLQLITAAVLVGWFWSLMSDTKWNVFSCPLICCFRHGVHFIQ